MLKSKLSRYEGAMLGVAVGDALGAPLEFMSADKIKSKHGTVRDMLGGGWLSTEPGEVTDDTAMTLCVAAGILANQKDPIPEIGERFINWYNTAPKDIGSSCAAAISRAKSNKAKTADAWHKAAEDAHAAMRGQIAGNGALMRTIYPALYYPEPTAHRVAADIARMTHWHDDSTLAVIAYVRAINEIVNADEIAGTGWAKEQVELQMKQVRERLGGKHVEPNGWAIASAVCAMNTIRDTNSFEDALVYAVNLGGDADTIGAITGGLAGAIYGSSEIPLRWINALKLPKSDDATSENSPATRLTDLAHIAYVHRTGEPNAATQFRNERLKIF